MVDEKICDLELICAVGLGEYTTLALQWINNTHGFLLMYNITSRDSFARVRSYYNLVSAQKSKHDHNFNCVVDSSSQLPIALLGINNNQESKREVLKLEGKSLAKELRYNFFELALTNDINIEKDVFDIVRKVRTLRRRQQHECLKLYHWPNIVPEPIECIRQGDSGIFHKIDDCTVILLDSGTVASMNRLDKEREVYRFLNQITYSRNTNVLKCFDSEFRYSLILESFQSSVRDILQSTDQPPSYEKIYKWAKQSAGGLSFLHRCRVIHGDFGCHNLYLDQKDNIK